MNLEEDEFLCVEFFTFKCSYFPVYYFLSDWYSFYAWYGEQHTKARFHVAVRTQINKFVFYFIVRRNVKFGCSEC